MTADETVTEFIRRITSGDLDGALELCADDLEYDNVPMPTLHGRGAARDFLAGMLDGGNTTSWVVHRQVAAGDVVLNERTDSFIFRTGGLGGVSVDLPVAGVFELRDGRIALWRDYFDLRSFETQLAGG